MKKTMFITSVIMVVVMAIALTTSSLAWFSAAGSDTVTTAAFKVTATATSSTGIQISKDRSVWDTQISLTSTGNSGLNPLLPYLKRGAYDSSTEGDAAAIYNALLAALVGGEEDAYDADTSTTYDYYGTSENDTQYAAHMIGAKIDSNQKFTAQVQRTGFYTDTFYLQNMASGTGAQSINFDTTITFSFDARTGTSGAYTFTDTGYTKELRGAAKYELDPTLCVAVLALKNDQIANADYAAYQAAVASLDDAKAALALLTSEDDGYAAAVADVEAAQAAVDNYYGATWEIIAYAESKGNNGYALTDETAGHGHQSYVPATIRLGKTYAEFLSGKTASNSYFSMPLEDLTGAYALNKTNTTALRAARTYDGANIPADIKTVKVVAWYDGATLNNNNSSSDQYDAAIGEANLKFALSFKVHTNG